MQTRPYGTTGDELSLIALGGIVVAGLAQDKANRVVREAFDRGVNYFDVAPSYGDAEERLGPALQGLRDRVFLACKTNQRRAKEAKEELHRSLSRLKTDRFDLYQLHGLSSVKEVDTCFATGGAMETFVQARRDGLIRHIGLSAHSEEAALSAMERFAFDSILFPLSFITYHTGHFGGRILKAAQENGVTRLALKAMARRPWPEAGERRYPKCWYEPFDTREEAELALRWTLSQPVTAAIPPGDPKLFWMALDIAERFTPLTPEEQTRAECLLRDTRPIFGQAA